MKEKKRRKKKGKKNDKKGRTNRKKKRRTKEIKELGKGRVTIVRTVGRENDVCKKEGLKGVRKGLKYRYKKEERKK